MKVSIIFLQHTICIKHIHIEFRRTVHLKAHQSWPDLLPNGSYCVICYVQPNEGTSPSSSSSLGIIFDLLLPLSEIRISLSFAL